MLILLSKGNREREDAAKAFKQDFVSGYTLQWKYIYIFFVITMYCLGEKPRGEISEDQYRSCQNAAKIR